jgi:hypothetical protein
MALASRNTKQQAYELIDRMAPGQVSAVFGLLKIMLDPVSRYRQRTVRRRTGHGERGEIARGSECMVEAQQAIPHEQVLAELGITQEGINHFREPK